MFFEIPTLRAAADSMYTLSLEPATDRLCSLMHFMCICRLFKFVSRVVLSAALCGGFERRRYRVGLHSVTGGAAIVPVQAGSMAHKTLSSK